jgi:hypothetical protein
LSLELSFWRPGLVWASTWGGPGRP